MPTIRRSPQYANAKSARREAEGRLIKVNELEQGIKTGPGAGQSRGETASGSRKDSGRNPHGRE